MVALKLIKIFLIAGLSLPKYSVRVAELKGKGTKRLFKKQKHLPPNLAETLIQGLEQKIL